MRQGPHVTRVAPPWSCPAPRKGQGVTGRQGTGGLRTRTRSAKRASGGGYWPKCWQASRPLEHWQRRGGWVRMDRRPAECGTRSVARGQHPAPRALPPEALGPDHALLLAVAPRRVLLDAAHLRAGGPGGGRRAAQRSARRSALASSAQGGWALQGSAPAEPSPGPSCRTCRAMTGASGEGRRACRGEGKEGEGERATQSWSKSLQASSGEPDWSSAHICWKREGGAGCLHLLRDGVAAGCVLTWRWRRRRGRARRRRGRRRGARRGRGRRGRRRGVDRGDGRGRRGRRGGDDDGGRRRVGGRGGRAAAARGRRAARQRARPGQRWVDAERVDACGQRKCARANGCAVSLRTGCGGIARATNHQPKAPLTGASRAVAGHGDAHVASLAPAEEARSAAQKRAGVGTGPERRAVTGAAQRGKQEGQRGRWLAQLTSLGRMSCGRSSGCPPRSPRAPGRG